MSVDGQVLGAGTIGGGVGGAAASLANTGNPLVVGFIAGCLIIVVAAFMTRASQKKCNCSYVYCKLFS